MKVLVILEKNPFADSSAANNRFLSLVEGLSQHGCKISLAFLQSYEKIKERNTFNSSGVYKKMNYRYMLPFYIKHSVIRRAFYKLLPVCYVAHKLSKNIKSAKYDFVWLGVSENITKIGLMLFKSNPCSNYIHERSEYSWISLPQHKKVLKLYHDVFIPQIDIFIVMTTVLNKYYKNYIGEKTKIIHIPMTVDFSRFSGVLNSSKLDTPYIGYCGSLSNQKDGVDILIKSFIKIMPLFPNLHLYIAGSYVPQKDYLQQKGMIIENKAESRIKHIGALSRSEIPVFLSNASVLAMARPRSKQAEGGFPTKLGEYLATGKPVCVTAISEIENYLTNNQSAFIAEPGSVDSFSDAIIRALTSENAERVGEEGLKVAMRSFNKDIQSKQLFDYLLKHRKQ